MQFKKSSRGCRSSRDDCKGIFKKPPIPPDPPKSHSMRGGNGRQRGAWCSPGRFRTVDAARANLLKCIQKRASLRRSSRPRARSRGGSAPSTGRDGIAGPRGGGNRRRVRSPRLLRPRTRPPLLMSAAAGGAPRAAAYWRLRGPGTRAAAPHGGKSRGRRARGGSLTAEGSVVRLLQALPTFQGAASAGAAATAPRRRTAR